MKLSALSLAVQGALTAMLVMPAVAYSADPTDAEISVIKRPTNFIEFGAENVSRSSAKFGEYTGLNKSGGTAIANFSVRGGDAYEAGEGTLRWGVKGTDLGTTSRELSGTVGNQGKWNLGIGYDELRHNLANTYQTPYQGNMGGNAFTLPAGFATAANATTLTAAQLAAFQTVEIGSTRKNTSLNAAFNFAPQWNITFDYNNLVQSGAKLMSFGSDNHGGAGGQTVSILPNPTNYKTDTVTLALNWAGDKGHFTGSYFGSFFRDGYDRVTWTTYRTTSVTDTMSTAPSNNFHQLNLSGGYALAAKTKLVGGFSYARNTQNDAFLVPELMVTAAPKASLDGVVVTTHADLKLTDSSIKNLALAAGIKYDKRDNRTASNIYNFNAINGGDTALYPNTPLSIQKTQFEVTGDYRLDKKQQILLGYNREDIKRWCNNYAVNALYPAGTNCVVAKAAKEDKLSATYKFRADDSVNMNVGYAIGHRRTESDVLARTAMIGVNGGAIGNTIKGLNGGDFVGFVPYFDEDRRQQILKAGVNWQATEKLSVGANGRYTRDRYEETYGWKSGNQLSLNLDAAYSYSDNGSLFAYLTEQNRKRDRTDLRTLAAYAGSSSSVSAPAGATDSGTLKDDDTTIGLGFKQRGLMGNKLELVGDLNYSLGKTAYSTTLNWVGGVTTAGLSCDNPQIGQCGGIPVIRNSMVQFKLTGTYDVDKSSKVAVGYLYRRLKSEDYYFNAFYYGGNPTAMLHTNQQAPSYSDNVVAVTYSYSFK